MRISQLIIFFLAFALFSNAQVPSFDWAKQFSGAGSERANCVKVDGNGNVYTTGGFFYITDFNPGWPLFNLVSYGQEDMFISKLDSAGNFLWAKKIGSAGFEVGNSISIDASNNIYLTGAFTQTTDFDPGPGVYTLTPGGGLGNLFVLKLDMNGNFIWVKQVTGTSEVIGQSVVSDPAGFIYVSGYFYSSADFDPGPGTFNLTNPSSTYFNSFVMKLDASGNFVWAKVFGSSMDDFPNALALDGSGNIYVAGDFIGSGDFDPGLGVFTLSSSGQDAYILKLNSSGNFIWALKIGGSGNDCAHGIDLDVSGNMFATGYFGNTTDFDPGINTYPITAGGQSDVFVLKLDSSGNFGWAKNFQGFVSGTKGSGNSIALDPSSAIYVTGVYNGITDFDPGLGTYSLNTISSSQDIFISKLDFNGNFVWAGQVGSVSADGVSSVEIDNWGGVYSTGTFDGLADFDPDAGTFSMTGNNNDIFVLKLNQCTAGITTVSSNSFICAGQTTTLTASGAISYTYYPGGITGNPIAVSPTVSTTYTVTGSTATCTKSTTIFQNVASCLGVDQLSYRKEIEFFPNPNNGVFSFVSTLKEPIRVEIYNSLGSLISKQNSIENKNRIDISDHAPGLYFIKLISDDKIITMQKIIKQ